MYTAKALTEICSNMGESHVLNQEWEFLMSIFLMREFFFHYGLGNAF